MRGGSFMTAHGILDFVKEVRHVEKEVRVLGGN